MQLARFFRCNPRLLIENVVSQPRTDPFARNLAKNRVKLVESPHPCAGCLGRYFRDRCDSLGCLNDLLSLSHVARLTTLPKSWSLCFRRRTLSNSSPYSTLFCSICGSETQPMAVKSCCACVLTKSFRALSIRAQSHGRSQESRRNTKALPSEWFCWPLR